MVAKNESNTNGLKLNKNNWLVLYSKKHRFFHVESVIDYKKSFSKKEFKIMAVTPTAHDAVITACELESYHAKR